MVETKKNNFLYYLLSYLFVLLMVCFTCYPILYTIIGSFKTNAELTQGGHFFPKTWHPENYARALGEGNFLRYALNSIIVSLSVMALAVVTTSMAGYTYARKQFIGKKVLLWLYTSLVFIALGAVTLYPTYRILMLTHLNKSLLGLIFALVGGQIPNVLLVMGFVKTIPSSIDEAAIIDGCTPYAVFFRIILPLLKPILAVVALFTFRSSWNDYLISFILSIFSPNIKTLTVAVVQLKYATNAAAEWHIMLAGASLSIIPILILYTFAHKQFIGGLTVGAVKG
ncbi:MAG: carbohydrate ABC transporter permease [Sphaerochaeta sp.]|jgi:ABC-type glycerol-3-phosphate transport system permease component|nr:carbohydrate ABC transporter permease [Sphaerochaeta sp.]MCH3919069.1 carbohydrate ABC transporter permease [Sphaerochaeta sp.]MCI2129003.1 carbohydrate ABC transporter permease [Sphaerochaeta sp.]